MKRKALRYGYTTGACAAAAAKGAAVMLRDQRITEEVEITLPGGETPRFRLHGQAFNRDKASCYVVKDAGDDPDVTDGAAIHATVSFTSCRAGGHEAVAIEGGPGIGKVTKPGLAVPVGEWAINPVPRRMITEAVRSVLASSPLVPRVVISIPNGEELARKTLNSRLGIIGGLSILGTTGIVRPVSADAWTATIDSALDVARACGCETAVLSTGRTSEKSAQVHLSGCKERSLPEEAFIIMGDHVGYALRSCAHKGFERVVIAAQFAKLVKIGCGHEQTHVSSSKLDLKCLGEWLRNRPALSPLSSTALLADSAREVLITSGYDAGLIAVVAGKAADAAALMAPGIEITVFLAGYHGEMLYCAERPSE